MLFEGLDSHQAKYKSASYWEKKKQGNQPCLILFSIVTQDAVSILLILPQRLRCTLKICSSIESEAKIIFNQLSVSAHWQGFRYILKEDFVSSFSPFLRAKSRRSRAWNQCEAPCEALYGIRRRRYGIKTEEGKKCTLTRDAMRGRAAIPCNSQSELMPCQALRSWIKK